MKIQLPFSLAESPSPSVASVGKDTKLAEAQNVAQEFETLFMDMMIKGMRQTAKPEDASNALDVYTGMLDQETAKTMSSSQTVGVKALILDWMKSSDPELAKEFQASLQTARSAAPTQQSAIQSYIKAQKAF